MWLGQEIQEVLPELIRQQAPSSGPGGNDVINKLQRASMIVSETLILRAALGARLYRDIEVSSSCTLADLAEAITAAFGFDMDHAYGYFSKHTGNLFKSPQRYELFADMDDSGSRGVKRTSVNSVFKKVGSAMTFLYDYGDEWRFRVEVIEKAKAQAGSTYPRTVKTIGTAPPQYPDFEDD